MARAGSTVAASKILRVNQSTVGRRIAALENALRAELFNKAATGYQLTAIGREIIGAAERAELQIGAVPMLVEGMTRRLAGNIAVTTNETVANLFLTPTLPEFSVLHPHIRIDVIVSSRTLDLERGEADVAIRAAKSLDAGPLTATCLSEIPWAVYGSRAYIETHGRPASEIELRQHKVIAADGSLAGVAGFKWLEANAGEEAVVARTNSLTNLMAAVRAGLGLSLIPCVRGEPNPEFVRCIGPNEDLQSFLWLITRNEIQAGPDVHAFRAFILSKAPAWRQMLRFNDDTTSGGPSPTIR